MGADQTRGPARPGGDPKPGSFESRFQEQQEQPFPWKAMVKRSIVVLIAGVALYYVLPELIAVLHSWPKLVTLNLLWFIPALLAELIHFSCTFSLQRIALRTKAWFSVITAQLAGNAISLIVPGGAAPGAALQFRMLALSGMDASEAVGGLTAFSFLGIGGLLALPVFVLPAVLFGSPVPRGLAEAAVLGAIGFVLFVGLGAWVMAADAPLRWAGRGAQAVRNRLLRKRAPLSGLPERLLEQRDLIRAVLGQQWWQATLLSAGRLAFDYLCLLFSVFAVGAHPRPSLILLAYAVAGVIGLVPITPGGLGIVEASLTALLILAGLTAGEAFLATLAYRLASYWLPLLSGPFAYAAFKHRYREPKAPPPIAARHSPI
ncbi:MAG: lysylphosphatidylglycerol synthase transmembrane domain-containing protein [Acidimicrobiales bacterium]